MVGTAAYMSPEQAQGKPLDGRSDIFSFGAVLYEMVTGRRAFAGDNTVSTLAAVLNAEPRPASELSPEVSRDLERIIGRCLRKDPARRFQHMDDLRVALEEVREEADSAGASVVPAVARRSRRIVQTAIIAAVLVATAAALWYAFRATPASPTVVIPITSYPGYEQHASFSPDGRQIAFSWTGEKQDNEDVNVVLTSGGRPLRLTTDPAPDTAPAWSPDGQHIAFIRSGAAYLISPLGGAEQRVVDTNGSSLCWTSEGASLAFRNGDSGLSAMSVTSGEQRKLTSPPQGETDDDCAFSGDGKYLAFVRWSATNVGRIYVASAGGTEQRAITTEGSWMRGLAWVPGRPELIAASNRLGWDSNLVRIFLNRGATGQVPIAGTEHALRPTLVRPSANAPVRLAYQRASSDWNVYRLDLASQTNSAVAALMPVAPSTRDELDPDLSPDGSRIALASAPPGNSRSGRAIGTARTLSS